MKRVLLLTLEYPPDRGGIASYLGELHSHVQDLVISRGAWWKLWPRWLPTIWHTIKIVKQRRIEILAISHVLPMGYVALLLSLFMRVPYVVYVHGLDLLRATKNPWKAWWVKRIFNRARFVVANSEFTAAAVSKCGVSLKQLVIVLPSLPQLPPLDESRTTSGGPIILSVARLVRRKNHVAVLDAVAALQPLFPGLQYVMIGDGPLRGELEKCASELEITSQVRFLGEVSDEDRMRYYQETDLFVLPTRSEGDDVEGFGIVFLEAASYAKPVIAGRGGGVAEAVAHGRTGLVVDPNNADELLEAVANLLLNPEIARELGRAGRERIEKEFLTEHRELFLEKIYSS